MTSKWKITIVAAIMAAGIASPAFAQGYDRTYGTGNPMATYYDNSGALHVGAAPQQHFATVPQQNRFAARQNGLNAFAMLPGGGSGYSSFSPRATGGGSLGYNENLRTDQW
jgi:hypothetical protein